MILAVGRMTEEKDFPTLMRAFARVRRYTPVRLVILGIQEKVDMPGFVDSPFQ